MELNNKLAMAHPKLIRAKVWCTCCGREQRISPGYCFQNGWPKCCGYTMTLDSPQERGQVPYNDLISRRE